MRLSLAIQILLTNAVVNHAFHTPTRIFSSPASASTSTALFSDSRLKNPEWDNDDFLAALSGTDEQRNNVNRVYLAQAEKTRESQARMANWRQQQEARANPNIPQATPPPPPPPPQSMLEDLQDKAMGGMSQPGISGGSKLRNMMEQSSQKQGMINRYPTEFTNSYQQQPPQQYQHPPPPPPQQYQQQPPPQPQVQQQQPLSDPNDILNQLAGVPPPNQQQQSTQIQDPNRPIGRNKDADQIANAADMYFAQLKLDSKIRKRAFLDGDYDTSNDVFADERVQDLPNELRKNPFIRAVTDQSVRNSELTTSEDEDLPTNLMYAASELKKPKYAQGLNYREKLKAMKNKKQNQVVDTPSPLATESVVDTPPVVEQSTSGPIAATIVPATTTVVDSNPLSSAQAALQEAIQKCQDPSLSDKEKSQILLSAQTALQEAASLLAAAGAK